MPRLWKTMDDKKENPPNGGFFLSVQNAAHILFGDEIDQIIDIGLFDVALFELVIPCVVPVNL